ncbi:MAG TPA: polyprenyl synthetase family protein [Armatimonadota bacterium]|jgi:geranylgeranyl diphosphate synthase type I
MNTKLSEELARIARAVRAIVLDPALRPAIAPAQLLTAALAYPQAGGKALRPALLTWACRALGGEEAPALRAGTAVELYHTYTLVHDDVIDRDPMRRGQPSVHTRMAQVGATEFALAPDEAAHYGLAMAILAGDVQQAWAIDLLASLTDLGVSPAVVVQLIRRMQGVTGPAILEGETIDIQLPFRAVADVTPEMIELVMRTKTAALFAYCTWAGGLLARGQEDDDVRALATFAERIGLAFQLQDDVLGLIGDEQKLGKPVGSDLREGKRTLIIALAWARANAEERAQLTAILGNAHATPDATAQATALLLRLGAVEEVQTLAQRHLHDALHSLDSLPENEAVSLLREVAGVMVEREK